jgi:hypothetical protein
MQLISEVNDINGLMKDGEKPVAGITLMTS